MHSRILRTEAPVCQLCSFISTHPSIRLRPLRLSASQESRPFSIGRKTFANKQRTSPNSSLKTRSASAKPVIPAQYDGAKLSGAVDSSAIENDLDKATSLRNELITKDGIPSENEIETVLAAYQQIADNIMNPHDPPSSPKDASATSALLSINKATTKSSPLAHAQSANLEGASRRLSDLTLSILEHPPVFITSSILRRYVNLQSTLKRPEPLPSVFHLYATKPVPVEGSSPVKYKEVNPNKSANAIEVKMANLALQTAIEAKTLVTAMDIVDTTYNTAAFRRTKFIRKALLPVTGLSLAPVAAYAVATQLSLYQTTMDPTVATNVAFVGILGYIGFTTVVAVVAVTTANDQMERITWATGMPLRERWIREEERAAIDKIAGAWGFREIWRRGEEEGEEWEALREWVARRGMILDRTELMEGME